MRKRLDRIRFRGQKRDDFVDLAESPNTSDTECSEEIVIKCQSSLRDSEELRDVDGGEQQSDSQVTREAWRVWDVKAERGEISLTDCFLLLSRMTGPI